MSSVQPRGSYVRATTIQRLEKWRQLCDLYLPEKQSGSIWRYHHKPDPHDPAQGWKLHVSATVINAAKVLAKIGSLLKPTGVQFKAPVSLAEVKRLNSGVHYSYSQIGKVITVYPRSDLEAATLAQKIHELTRHLSGPAVPYDQRYKSGSNVYYRYGAFRHVEMKLSNGERVSAIKDPTGKLHPDDYLLGVSSPSWAINPFPKRRKKRRDRNPLQTTYRVVQAFSQRGKGGVYLAIDLSLSQPRLCLIKEGRKSGELSWDGQDGNGRVRNEQRVLELLHEREVNVPQVFSSFELRGNFYLITEFIKGERFDLYLNRRKRRLSIRRAISYGLQLAGLLNEIHDAGFVWRDCKPNNLILTPQHELRPIDFEGASALESSDAIAWVTPGYSRTPNDARQGTSAIADDFYALGVVLHLLVTGSMPQAFLLPATIRKLRSDTPGPLSNLITALLESPTKLEPRFLVQQLEQALLQAQTGKDS